MIDKSDPKYAERKAKRKRLREDFEYYAPRCLKIKPKSGGLIPFELNRAQKELHDKAEQQLSLLGFIRIIILKGRQEGISTYVEGRFYWRVSHRKGVNAFILTHEDKATTNLFEMAETYHKNCPPAVRPVTGAANAKELSFSKLDSGYRVGTAGTKAVGRSSTNQFFHGSEVAFWPHADTHAAGIMQSVPREPGTEIFLESTADGIGNLFHAQWQLAESGQSDYIAVFLPWYWEKKYSIPVPDGFALTGEEVGWMAAFESDGLTKGHLAWRRMKVIELTTDGAGNGEWRFRQEYPFTATEAFQTSGEHGLILPEAVLRARKQEMMARGAKVVGVDPARFGSDSTGIAWRQGKVCTAVKRHNKKSTMQVAGICANILRDPRTEEPSDVDMMFIDVGGLGAGVYDRLEELGFEQRVTAVNFGEKATYSDKYVNKRSEMWCDMQEWFSMTTKIPDTDDLQADICGPMFSYDSAQRIKLERKEDMIKRGIRSPDLGDALALTFAYPVVSKEFRQRDHIPHVPPADASIGY